MKKTKLLTNCFLVKYSQNKIAEVCLAMKKRGLGEGKWNGSGGKVNDDGETIEQAAIREVKEELNIKVKTLKKAGILEFVDTRNLGELLICHVFTVDDWLGEPSESEEMAPKWFRVSEIPYNHMWVTDKHWFPVVLEGNLLKARFVFKDDETLEDYKVNVVKKFRD